jgi:hypothetical protein
LNSIPVITPSEHSGKDAIATAHWAKAISSLSVYLNAVEWMLSWLQSAGQAVGADLFNAPLMANLPA